MDVLKAENSLLDEKWKIESIEKQLSKITSSNASAMALYEKLAKTENLDASRIIQEIGRVTDSYVHKDEFLDLRAETGDLMTGLNELKVFRARIEQSQVDDHY